MRKLFWLLIPLLAITAGCSTGEGALVGKWRGSIEEGTKLKATPMGAMADKMKGYIDPQLNLRPDHTFVMSFAIAPIEGTWKLVKDDVILTPKTMFGMKSEEVQKQAAHAMEKAQSKSPIPLPFLLGGDALAMPKEMRGHMDSKHETMTLDPGEGTFISNFGQITFKKA